MVANYQILDRIGTTAGSYLHRAQNGADGSQALVKFPVPDMLGHAARFRREYAILRSLAVPGVAKPRALIDEPGQLMMVLDLADGVPLENHLAGRPPDWPFGLRMSLQLTHILCGLHAAHLVHRDIRPANLMLSADGQACLVDASLATLEPAFPATDNAAVGDWAYISPEQTGRMNRAVDDRTDLYALGVTLYRILTGLLPFQARDATEWVHCHLASLPRPPSDFNAAIPPVLSAIVLKLLAKMPEDRYQSARGLCFDLERCLEQWEAGAPIAPFDLGAHDVSDQFHIPHKLAGREAEIAQLLSAFDAMAVSGHPALLLVSGSAGVGKSALVHELQQPIMDRHGYFISGKFDQYLREIPYATVTQAFRELVQQILAESEAGIAAWRRQIQDAVGANGRLITDVLPQVELIIGAQPAVPALPSGEEQNRFRMVFQRFIGVFAQRAHPLALFLDDLQWVDAASLRLIRELVCSTERCHLLVIGAYRDNEVDPAHPLAREVDAMRRDGAALAQMALGPLSEEALESFIDDMLHCARGAAAPLAHLVYLKSAGNPFFTIQFISALVEEGMICFDAEARTWRWDLDRISAKGYTDNVAELMVEKLARLPAPVQAALQRLACLGSGARYATLVKVSDQPEADTRAALATAVRAGLVFSTGGMVRFLHDRVQEAAYLSMPASARTALHLHIGRLLMAGKTQAQVEDAVFPIVSQLNCGASDIVDADEKALLCHLNFVAGKKAKAAVAYASARSFLERAMALLPSDAWQVHYQDALALTLALSECEYLVGNFERADELAKLVLANARSRRDSARVHHLRITLYQMAGRLDAAVASMVEGARLFEMAFPTAGADFEAAIGAEVDDIAAWLQGRRIADIADARPLADADVATVLSLLVEAIPAAYMVRPHYFALIIARAVRLSLCHGHTEDSCFAYSAYGIVLLAHRGDIVSALAFSDMAMRLNEKLAGRRHKGRLLATHAIAYGLLKDAIGDAVAILDQALAASLEVGDLVYANYITMVKFWLMMQQGVSLDEVLQAVRRHAEFARASHNDPVYQTLRLQQQFVASMQGRTRAPASIDDEHFDEAACLATLERASFGFGIKSYHIIKQALAFIFGDCAGAFASAHRASLHTHQAGSILAVDAVHHFLFALTLAALYPQVSGARKLRYASMLAAAREQHAAWAAHCPSNFRDRHALLGAEIARIEGRESEAAGLYEQAISAAGERGFIQNKAIAYELAAAFYRGRGFALIADTYLGEACACYRRWGAVGKVAQLEARYPRLLAEAVPATAGLVHDVAHLDLLSVAKASQAISSRIVLVELVDTLMHIVLENAGAQRGQLLIVRNDELMLAADANIDRHTVQVRHHLGQRGAEVPLPASIVNFVRRSREQVLLTDLAQSNAFSHDPYFASRQPKSVLCLPILRQDTLIGVLYLENELITHAFAPERVAVLKLLASQAAISLENAGLYADLQEREAKIRRLVDSNIVGILFYELGGNITGANDAALAIIGYSRQDLLDGKVRWSDMTPPEGRAANVRAVDELMSTRCYQPVEREYLRKDGSRVPVMVAAAMFEGSNDQGVAFVLDLSERRRAEEQVRHMANHDALTGLPNRVLLQDRLDQAIAYSHRHRSQVAILFIDLDHFKHINDSLGHHIGDVVLQMTGSRLQQCLREGDSVARLGGDEFVIILPVLSDSSEAARVAQKALDALAEPFMVEGHELHFGGSIGISLYPDDGSDVETLMRTADTAMYHAKEMGRSNFQFFTAALNQAAQQRLEVGMRLRHALMHDEFVLHYQPQVDMESGAILSAEALLRWQRPGSEPMSCGSFIANAEESGLIVPIGEWALRAACRQLKLWHEAGHATLKMAVNLSPRQLEPADFCEQVAHIIAETGIPANALELEITESILLQRSELNLAALTTLRDMGIQLSVDDFGTGYSSLAYLQRFPVHALKIDQSFVHDIGTDPNDTALITAIIAMANSLQLRVMAEGVETLEQARFLLAHGCRSAQGFFYSEAVPAPSFVKLLHKRAWRADAGSALPAAPD